MNKVLLRPNPTRANTLQVTSTVASNLIDMGFEVFMGRSFQSMLSDPIVSQIVFCEDEEVVDRCDFVVVVGGDGTILRIAEAAAKKEKPILGINVGTMGFMSELEIHELWEIEKVRDGSFSIDSRMMLDVSIVDANGKTVYNTIALNDAVISKGNISRVVRLSVLIDGREALAFSGDGVIVCTPTGSTAYSLSAGGPILEPSSSCIAVTPICPHAFNAKSVVLKSGRMILVTSPEQENPVFLSIDGFKTFPLEQGCSVRIRQSPYELGLIKLKTLGFYEIVRKKLTNERVEL